MFLSCPEPVRRRSRSRRRDGARIPSRLDIPSAELRGETRAGRRPWANPQLLRGRGPGGRRPRRRRLSEEVGPLTAEHRSRSHQLPGASSWRPREPSVPPGVRAGPSPPLSTRAPAAMGASASSQLDEGKCAYIRGTPARGTPGPCPPRGGVPSGSPQCTPVSTPRSLPAGTGVLRSRPARV